MIKIKFRKYIILGLLAISICINFILYIYILHTNAANGIVGTYCSGTGISGNEQYIVFLREGSYTVYKQFEVLEEGKYESKDASIYILYSEEDALARSVIYNGANIIYMFDMKKQVVQFDRISWDPIFINLPSIAEALIF